MIPNTNGYETPVPVVKPKVDIDTLLVTKLPPSPGTMMRIADLLRDYNSSMHQIAQAISYEPVLVVRILRLANSPIYALERNVTSIQSAIQAVGTKAVHDIVLIGMASTTFSKEIKNSPIAKRIWEHSIAVAMTARELSKMLGMRGTEEAFTCGLLHDIGKLILLSNFTAGFTAISEITDEAEMLNYETELYGYTHAEVGSLIARRWNLPEEVYYSILHHHNPSQSEGGNLVAHLVDVADILCNIKGYGLRPEEETKLETSESVMKLGFTPQHLENAWKNSEGNVLEVIKTFS
ncbi:MAG: HDOD domain-containing protein [Pyrinomonadaceae bacterium]